jgi:hypothetical protein
VKYYFLRLWRKITNRARFSSHWTHANNHMRVVGAHTDDASRIQLIVTTETPARCMRVSVPSSLPNGVVTSLVLDGVEQLKFPIEADLFSKASEFAMNMTFRTHLKISFEWPSRKCSFGLILTDWNGI